MNVWMCSYMERQTRSQNFYHSVKRCTTCSADVIFSSSTPCCQQSYSYITVGCYHRRTSIRGQFDEQARSTVWKSIRPHFGVYREEGAQRDSSCTSGVALKKGSQFNGFTHRQMFISKWGSQPVHHAPLIQNFCQTLIRADLEPVQTSLELKTVFLW